jgi:hypothetical protein
MDVKPPILVPQSLTIRCGIEEEFIRKRPDPSILNGEMDRYHVSAM